MKTIKEWFESFPDPDIRARLLANLKKQRHANANVRSFREALMIGFAWAQSIECQEDPVNGHTFWFTIYSSLPEVLPATTAEYYADLRNHNAKLRQLHSAMTTLLRKIQNDFGWMADLSNAGTRFLDEAQTRETLQSVEDLIQRIQDSC